MDTRYLARSVHEQTGSGPVRKPHRAGGLDETEPDIVVPVVGLVPVPV
jgi:hypothetical protein